MNMYKICPRRVPRIDDRFFAIAMAQMMTDLWKALENDHEEVGD